MAGGTKNKHDNKFNIIFLLPQKIRQNCVELRLAFNVNRCTAFGVTIFMLLPEKPLTAKDFKGNATSVTLPLFTG